MKQVYYGWYVVVAAAIVYTALQCITYGAFGVFVLPVSEELHLSRADINTALIFKNIGNALWAPVVGYLLDRGNPKPVMLACSLLFAASFIILGMTDSLWLGAFIMGVAVPIGYQGAGSLANAQMLARWFKHRRGRAMVLAGIGLPCGIMVGAPIAGFLVETYGWRPALIMMGAATGVLLFALALVIRTRPGLDDVEPVSASAAESATPIQSLPEGPRLTMFGLLGTPLFLMIAGSTAIAFAGTQAINISMVPMAKEGGMSMVQATSIVSLIGATAVVTALCFSTVADRFNRVTLLSTLFVLEAVVNLVLMFDKSYTMLLACALALGFISGTVVPSFAALLADRFGPTYFATVRGTALALSGATGMVSVRFAGEVFDRTGKYDVMFATFFVSNVVAAVLMFATRYIGARVPANATAP